MFILPFKLFHLMMIIHTCLSIAYNRLDRHACIFQDTKVEAKTQAKAGFPRFPKKSGKGSLDGSEKDTPTTSVAAAKLNSPHALLSKLKNQVLLNQKAKLKLHHDLIREKVTNIN